MEHDFEVVAIGEVNVDLLMIGVRDIPRWGTEVLCDTMALRLGGSTANFACAAAALGLRTALVSWIGEDDFGQFLVSQ
ncbi:MAG: carbohydrate kinase family protein, partial [Armatimonadetes bacterium]|nr:carbohydrate kinase family protein [Armatimonadota bacterium]